MSVYIFCLSNLSVPTVLSICEKEKNFKIVTDQPSLFEFFTNAYDGSSVILIKKPPVFSGIRKVFKPLLLNKYKRELMNTLGRPKGGKIYFFYNAFGTYVSWWLTKIAKENTIFYKPDLDISMWTITYSIKNRIEQMWTLLCFSTLTLPAFNGERIFYKVSQQFITKHNIVQLENIEINWSYIEEIIGLKFKLGKKKYLLLTGNNVSDRLISENEFIVKNDELISMLGINEVAVKVHPRFNYLHSLENNCLIVPSYIPANVIIPYFDVFFGYTSSVLFEAANRGKQAISLIDYFDPISVDRQVTYKEYLIANLDSGASMQFPKNLNELSILLHEEPN